jgi:CubicO group peptidase (beta-lactamase class C family)
MIRLILLLLLFGAGATALPAQTADRFAPVRATIKRFLDSTNTASVAVAVAKDGKIIWEEGFGWANREKMLPATQHTMYSLASISKPFTATGLMVLVDRGRVGLDQPANDYLGLGKLTGLAGDASRATVRRVLSHTAGLPLHYQFYYADRGYGPPTMDEAISRYGNLVFPPGKLHEYSNLGFGIIDHIIERASGQRYADFMRSEVFLPLGLTRTAIDIPRGMEDYAAERYDGDQKPIPFYTFDHVGASAVYSSAHDLVRFGMFHLKNRLPDQRPILKPESIDLMHQPVEPASYGLGFRIAPDDMGFRRFGHTGGMPGVATGMNLYPTENLAIVVLSNTGNRPDFIAQDIAAILLPRYADSLKVRRGRPAPAPRSFAVTPELIGQWSGTLRTWDSAVAVRMLVKPDGDIHIWLGNQPRAILNDVSLIDGRLAGRFAGEIPTQDAKRWPHFVMLGLLLQDGTLKGQANAMSLTDPIMYSLASYLELKRQP